MASEKGINFLERGWPVCHVKFKLQLPRVGTPSHCIPICLASCGRRSAFFAQAVHCRGLLHAHEAQSQGDWGSRSTLLHKADISDSNAASDLLLLMQVHPKSRSTNLRSCSKEEQKRFLELVGFQKLTPMLDIKPLAADVLKRLKTAMPGAFTPVYLESHSGTCMSKLHTWRHISGQIQWHAACRWISLLGS